MLYIVQTVKLKDYGSRKRKLSKPSPTYWITTLGPQTSGQGKIYMPPKVIGA